jgi:two-component system phosphate regulon sensor histidine kinase PhoR
MPDDRVTRRRIWVVDDSPLDAERARRALCDEYLIDAFCDGSAALERLAAGGPTPDVIILDWLMAGVSGIDVCRFLRSHRTFGQVAVLLLTVQHRTEQIVEGLQSGANDYLVKPYAEEELHARIRALVRTKSLIERAELAESRVRKLLESSPDALLAIDAEGVLTYANREAQIMLQRPASELVGRPISQLLPELPIRNISIAPGEGLVPLPDVQVGEEFYAPTVRFLPGDDAARTTVALRKVTEQRRATERRLDFYSMVAHDLRSPLQAILIRLELMLRGARGPVPAELVADLRKVDASARSLVGMANDFLELARMEGTGRKIERTELNLTSVVNQAVDDLRPLIEVNRLRLRVEEPPAEAQVLGDHRRLLQVVSNLVGNAIKFTPPEGSILTRVTLGDQFVETAVVDSGPGIEPQLLPSIFERFVRGAEGNNFTGSGLGLLIAREIVEAHGGTIGVDSQKGQGSTFWFRLPRAGATTSA